MSVWEERWAERDARRVAYEAELDAQFARQRAEHIETVYKALASRWFEPVDPGSRRRLFAETAVDALIASGVVFARIGTWDEEEDTP